MLKASEPVAGAGREPVPPIKEADQQTARELVAQMTALVGDRRLRAAARGLRRGRVAWVELLADADIQSNIEAEFETASNVVRERLAADEAARADAERQRRALEQEQADRIAVCAGSKRSPATTLPTAGAGARDVGRHAGDARRLGRRARSPLRRSVPRRREALTSASQLAQAVGRTPADAGARGRSARRPTPTTTTSAASGTRCASSGRRSRATSRSTPSCATRYDAAAQKLEAHEADASRREGPAAGREPAAAAGAGAEVRDPRVGRDASRSSRPISS